MGNANYSKLDESQTNLNTLKDNNIIHEKIFSLSSNSNCTPETYTCYIIVANCHYIKIFETHFSSMFYKGLISITYKSK